MSFPAPRPVISGKAYPVQQVGGVPPQRLDDFTGDSSLLIDLDGEPYTIWGACTSVDGVVRVHEKSDDGRGKDIRVWVVRQDGEGFTATHPGVDVPGAVARSTAPA